MIHVFMFTSLLFAGGMVVSAAAMLNTLYQGSRWTDWFWWKVFDICVVGTASSIFLMAVLEITG